MQTPSWRVRIATYLCAMLTACGAPTSGEQPLANQASPVQASLQTPAPVVESTPQGSLEVAVSHGGPVRNYVSLIDSLRAQGVEVEPGDTVRQQFLQAQGWHLSLRGGPLPQPATIQSYWYDDTELGKDSLAAAQEDAAQIQQGSGIKTAEWVAPPHFFRKERAFVIYVGTDSSVLALLTELMGPQFAGE